MIDFDKLKAPFPARSVSWRVGSTTGDKSKGMALAYIDSRDVQQRLDEVCGPAGWQDRYEVHGNATICYLSLKIGDEWVTKADGAGDTDVEAEKGRLSDSFKRAAVKWGIGRYLYDLESPWVEIEPAGRSFRIKKSEYARLERLLGGEAPKAEGRSQVQTPLNSEIEPDPSTKAALTYMNVAIPSITRFQGTAAELRQWWDDEKPKREKYDLTQAQVDILRGKLIERAEALKPEKATV